MWSFLIFTQIIFKEHLTGLNNQNPNYSEAKDRRSSQREENGAWQTMSFIRKLHHFSNSARLSNLCTSLLKINVWNVRWKQMRLCCAFIIISAIVHVYIAIFILCLVPWGNWSWIGWVRMIVKYVRLSLQCSRITGARATTMDCGRELVQTHPRAHAGEMPALSHYCYSYLYLSGGSVDKQYLSLSLNGYVGVGTKRGGRYSTVISPWLRAALTSCCSLSIKTSTFISHPKQRFLSSR